MTNPLIEPRNATTRFASRGGDIRSRGARSKFCSMRITQDIRDAVAETIAQ